MQHPNVYTDNGDEGFGFGLGGGALFVAVVEVFHCSVGRSLDGGLCCRATRLRLGRLLAKLEGPGADLGTYGAENVGAFRGGGGRG